MRHVLPPDSEISVAVRARSGFAYLVARYGIAQVQEVVLSDGFNIGCKCKCALAQITKTNDYMSACELLGLDPYGLDAVMLGVQTTEIFIEGEPRTEAYWLEIDALNDAWIDLATAAQNGPVECAMAA